MTTHKPATPEPVARAWPTKPCTTAQLLVAAVAVVGGAGVALDQPALALLCLVLMFAAALNRRVRGDLALILGALLCLALAIVVGLIAALTGLDVVGRWTPWVLLALVLSGSLCYAPTVDLPPRPSPSTWWAFAPAAVSAGIGLVQGIPGVSVAWALSSTDLAQHVLGLQEVRADGALDYGSSGYPRGFHALAVAVAPGVGAGGLVDDIQLLAACSWLALSLVSVAAAGTVLRLGTLTALGHRATGLSALGLGALLLTWNPLLQTFVHMGAVPSLLGAAVILALGLLVLDHPKLVIGSGLLAVGSAAVMLLAHLWQPLVLAPVCAVLALLLLPRGGSPRSERVMRDLATGLVLLTLATPAFTGLLAAGGTRLAAIPGEIAAPPWPVPLVALLLSFVLLRPHLHIAVGQIALTAGLTGAAVVLMLGSGAGLSLEMYYPRKALWFVALVSAPAAAVLVALLLSAALVRLAAVTLMLGRATAVGRSALTSTAVAVVVAFVLPVVVAAPSATLGAVRALWDSAADDLGRERLQIAAVQGRRHAPAVTLPVAVGRSVVFDRHGSYVVAKLLAYTSGQTPTHGQPHQVCNDARIAAAGRQVVVVTRLDPLVLRRYMEVGGCAHLRVVQIPGRITEVDFLRTPKAVA